MKNAYEKLEETEQYKKLLNRREDLSNKNKIINDEIFEIRNENSDEKLNKLLKIKQIVENDYNDVCTKIKDERAAVGACLSLNLGLKDFMSMKNPKW